MVGTTKRRTASEGGPHMRNPDGRPYSVVECLWGTTLWGTEWMMLCPCEVNPRAGKLTALRGGVVSLLHKGEQLSVDLIL